MLNALRPTLVGLGVSTLVLGLGYPLAMTGIAQAVFPAEAHGSLTFRDGQAVGSTLIGQGFSQPGYLHPRPSAAGNGYDGSSSSGTNLGPTSAKLAERIKTDADAMKSETGAKTLPADAVTTSGSGLDPDISPAYAELQAPRIAEARGVSLAAVRTIIAGATSGRTFAVLGEPRVNVLAVNLALDGAAPRPVPAAPSPSVPTASSATPTG